MCVQKIAPFKLFRLTSPTDSFDSNEFGFLELRFPEEGELRFPIYLSKDIQKRNFDSSSCKCQSIVRCTLTKTSRHNFKRGHASFGASFGFRGSEARNAARFSQYFSNFSMISFACRDGRSARCDGISEISGKVARRSEREFFPLHARKTEKPQKADSTVFAQQGSYRWLRGQPAQIWTSRRVAFSVVRF